jgi:hypothetical protein
MEALALESAVSSEIIEIVEPGVEAGSKSPSEPWTDADENATVEIIGPPITVRGTGIGIV